MANAQQPTSAMRSLSEGVLFTRPAITTHVPAQLPTAHAIAEQLHDAATALNNGDVITYLKAYASIGAAPARAALLSYARKSLRDGRLDDALFTYAIVNTRPEEYYLQRCAQTAHDKGDQDIERRALYLAQNDTHGRERSGLLARILAILRT